MRRKRTLGIVVAILAIQARHLTPRAKSTTHPPPYQRLAEYLYYYPLDANDKVLAVAAANLQILLAQRGVAATDLDQASFDALVAEFLLASSLSLPKNPPLPS